MPQSEARTQNWRAPWAEQASTSNYSEEWQAWEKTSYFMFQWRLMPELHLGKDLLIKNQVREFMVYVFQNLKKNNNKNPCIMRID